LARHRQPRNWRGARSGGAGKRQPRGWRHVRDPRLPYSRANFERVPHLVGGLWIEHHADIEDCLIQEREIPKEAQSISVSLDRTSVPMEEPVPRPPGRPRKGAPKVERNFRMAFCGTVTLHGNDGEALFTLRYGQTPSYDPQLPCNSMANDVQQLCDRRPDLRLSLLGDGAAGCETCWTRTCPRACSANCAQHRLLTRHREARGGGQGHAQGRRKRAGPRPALAQEAPETRVGWVKQSSSPAP